MTTEKDRLDTIAADSHYAKGVNPLTIAYSSKVFRRFWGGTRCLELGPAEGMMTGILVEAFPRVTVVEGAETFCRSLSERFPGLTVHNALFENCEPGGPFDTIILGHVLEHVDDPVAILKRVKTWLSPDGVVCAAVPNARSIHRQAAVKMGILPSEDSLNEADLHHGHRRVYNPESFRNDFRAAGLRVRHFGGYWLKPISNGQLERDWTPEMIDAFMELGECYPDIAGEIYVIAAG